MVIDRSHYAFVSENGFCGVSNLPAEFGDRFFVNIFFKAGVVIIFILVARFDHII